MKFVKDLFSESSNASMMRFMCFIVCVTACYVAIFKGQDSVGLVATLLASAFGGKGLQKFAEKKDE